MTGDQHATLWAAGLPRAGERPLHPAEGEAVQREGRRRLTLGLGFSAGVLLAGTALVTFLVANANDRSPSLPQVTAVLALLGTISGLLLVASRHLILGARLLHDSTHGTVDQFVDIRAGHEVNRLEVLPRSGLPWDPATCRVAVNRPLPRRRIADLPAFARLAAEWVEPVQTREGATVHVSQRELTSQEVGEVRRLRVRVCLGPVAVALALCVWCLGALGFGAVTGRYLPGHTDLALLLLAISSLVSLVNAGNALRLGWRLARDARLGRVGIMRYPQDQADAVPGAPLGPPLEVLPNCGILWSRGGQPAPWRIGT